MLAAWGSAHGLYILNPPGPTHQAGGVLDLAFGPAAAFAEFAHWASDHRTLVVSLVRVCSIPLPPPRSLPRSRFAKAAALLETFIPRPRQFHSPQELEDFVWAIFDAMKGMVGRFVVPSSPHTKSAPWWSEVLQVSRDTDPLVFRKLCKEARMNYYRNQAATATSLVDWGRILKGRKGSSDDRPSCILVNGRSILNVEDIAAYLATQAFRPAGAGSGPRPLWSGPKIPPDLRSKLVAPPSDEELTDSFLGASSNTPGPDEAPLAFVRHAWPMLLPVARCITEACIRLGALPSAFKQATVVTLSKPGRNPRFYKG